MRLHQVILFAVDVPRLQRFYVDVLGLRPLDEPATPGWVRLDAGGCLLALHAIPAPIAAKIAISDPPRVRAETPIKLTFHVDDVEAKRAELAARGAGMQEVRRFGEV